MKEDLATLDDAAFGAARGHAEVRLAVRPVPNGPARCEDRRLN